MTQPRTLIQQMYFDVCDLIYWNSYQDIGYDNRKDFLLVMRDRLAELETQLFPEVEK
jgi:hypothetical protein